MMVMLLSHHSAASSKIFLSCKKQHQIHASSSNYTFLRKSYSTASASSSSSSSSSCAEVEESAMLFSSPLLMLPPEYITVPRNEETLGMSQKNIVNFQFFSPTEKKFMKLSNRMLPHICFHSSWYFVESPEGDLLYVDRIYSRIAEDGSFTDEDVPGPPYRTTWFTVYKFEFGKKEIDDVHSLGDTVLFVGRSEAFSVRASDHPGLKPNSIYFDDDAFHEITLPDVPAGCAGHDTGVFDLETKEVTPLYEPFQMNKILPAPLWVFPNP